MTTGARSCPHRRSRGRAGARRYGEIKVFATSGRGRAARERSPAVLGDESGVVTLKWFRGGEAVAAHVKKGVRLRATGDVRRYRFSKEVIHPEIDLLREGEEGAAPGRNRAGVPGAGRRPAADVPALGGVRGGALLGSGAEHAAGGARGASASCPRRPKRCARIHRPELEADPEALRRRQSGAHERLVLEELYLLEVGLALRHAERAKEPGIALDPARPGVAEAKAALPFTSPPRRSARGARSRATSREPHPDEPAAAGRRRQRQDHGGARSPRWPRRERAQAALMAPTELLAEQHARTLGTLLAGAPRAAPRAAHRVGAARRGRRASAPRSPAASSTWWSARTRCSRPRCDSRGSGWW